VAFLKYQKQNDTGNGGVFWSRANQDGAPFRGRTPALLREAEYEQLAERVYDGQYGLFNTRKPDQRCGSPQPRTLQEVLDAIANGLYEMVDYDRFWHVPGPGKRPTVYVFIVWREPYMELPARPAQELEATTDQYRRAAEHQAGFR